MLLCGSLSSYILEHTRDLRFITYFNYLNRIAEGLGVGFELEMMKPYLLIEIN